MPAELVSEVVASTTTDSSTEVVSSIHPVEDSVKLVIDKVKSNQLVLSSLDKLTSFSKSVLPVSVTDQVTKHAQTVTELSISLGTPLVQKVDQRLNKVYTTLQPSVHSVCHKGLEVKDVWFQNVNKILSHSTQSLQGLQQMEWKGLLNHFQQQASDTFFKVSASSKNTKDEFVAQLKLRLEKVWDDALVGPAEVFFDKAKQLYAANTQTTQEGEQQDNTSAQAQESFLAKLRIRLGAGWEQSVVHTYQTKVRDQAYALYLSGYEQYVSLSEQQKNNLTNFMTAMKDKLGHTYSDKLEQPLHELYNLFKTKQTGVVTGVSSLWHGLLLKSQQGVDYILPPLQQEQSEEEEEAKQKEQAEKVDTDVVAELSQQDVSLTSLRSVLNQRVRSHATHHLEHIRQAGSDRLFNLITLLHHLQTSSGVVVHNAYERAGQAKLQAVQAKDIAVEKAAPAVAAVSQRVEHVYQQVKHSMESLQATLTNYAQSTTTSLNTTLQSVSSSISHSFPPVVQTHLTELQSKLQQALATARSKGHVSSEYVRQHRFTRQATDLLAALSTRPKFVLEQLNEKQQQAVQLLTHKLDELTQHLKEFLHLKKQEEQAQVAAETAEHKPEDKTE